LQIAHARPINFSEKNFEIFFSLISTVNDLYMNFKIN
jgi:hypothetical protein